MALDAIFGEPKWLWDRLPHPAVFIGRAIARADARFNRSSARTAKGVLLVEALLLGALSAGLAISLLGWLAEALCAAVLLAHRSLVDHVRRVAEDLRDGLAQGRRAVAMIVGRDTAQMDAPAISRAAIESAAENLSDGVLSPILWFAIGGLPAMLAYKAINTADSMIGYLTPHHREFGWAAAKLDDVLNWAPARLTALLILLSHGALRHWPDVRREAPQHRSPNAGWPESALAHALGIALSGPRAYDGELREFPFVNPQGARDLGAEDIERAIRALWRVWGLTFSLVLFIALL